MENNYTNLELITRYFDGELSEAEIKGFEKAMKEDQAFADEAAFYKDMISVVQESGTKQQTALLDDIDIDNINTDFRAKLVAQNERLTTTPKKAITPTPTAKVRQLNPLRRILSIAASVLALITAGTFWYANSNFSKPALSASNYMVADIPGTMGGDNQLTATFQKGLNTFWVKKDGAAAKADFAQITVDSPEYLEAQYFLGHIAFQEKDFIAAIDRYQTVLAEKNLPSYINRDKLTWNLLLARLGAGENIQTDLEQLIQDTNNPLNGQAKDLKKQLGGFWSKLTF